MCRQCILFANPISDIAQDAVNIFTRYIAQDAERSLGLTDHLRNQVISEYSRFTITLCGFVLNLCHDMSDGVQVRHSAVNQ